MKTIRKQSIQLLRGKGKYNKIEEAVIAYAMMMEYIKTESKRPHMDSAKSSSSKGDVEEAQRALSSMLHKCERAQDKLDEGTWQWTLMRDNIHALQLALSLITKPLETNGFTKADLEEAHRALSSAVCRVGKAQEKLTQGTSQWTLAKNRIHALQLVLSLITQALENT